MRFQPKNPVKETIKELYKIYGQYDWLHNITVALDDEHDGLDLICDMDLFDRSIKISRMFDGRPVRVVLKYVNKNGAKAQELLDLVQDEKKKIDEPTEKTPSSSELEAVGTTGD